MPASSTITEATIKVHVKAILRKIGATNRTQAAMWASQRLPQERWGISRMSEVVTTRLRLEIEVRVHFHPPGPWKSFSEGVVRRVDVTTPAGRFFVLEVRNEVILDQPHRIRPGFHDFVRYECRNDFPGRIEILSTAEQDVERNPTSDPILGEPPEEPQHEAHEQHSA